MNLVFMYTFALLILLDLIRIIHRITIIGKLEQPMFFSASVLATALFIYGKLGHWRALIYSAESFAAAGLFGIAEAIFARARGRLTEYDSSLGSTGPALLISSTIAALSVIGM